MTDIMKMTNSDLYAMLTETEKLTVGKRPRKSEMVDIINSRTNQVQLVQDEIDADKAVDIMLTEGIMIRLDSHIWWGKSNKTSEGEIQFKGGRTVTKKVLTGTKTLVDPDSLAYFRSLVGYAKRWLDKSGYPFLNIRGVVWIPKFFIQPTERKLKKWKANFDNAVEGYILDYPAEIERWKETLKEEKVSDVFDELVYPSPEELKRKLQFRWTKFAISLPSVESGVLNDKEYKEELERHKQDAKLFLDSTVTIIAKKFAEMVTSMQKTFASGRGIKQKSLDNMREFVETFDVMNITRNQELKNLVDRAAKLIGSVNKEDVKSNEKLSKTIATGLTGLVSDFGKAKDEKIVRALEF